MLLTHDVVMRHLYYAGNSVLLADVTCKALLRYARALSNAGKSDIATVPVINEGGSHGYAHILIGPSSQIFSTPVADGEDGPVDNDTILEMERLTREILPSTPAWPFEMKDVDSNSVDFDL
jgi:hypothetical protein